MEKHTNIDQYRNKSGWPILMGFPQIMIQTYPTTQLAPLHELTNGMLVSSSGTICDDDILLEYAKLGSYCEWDLFGLEVSLYQVQPSFFMPSDQQRIRAIKLLLDNGYEDSVVIAHDHHSKHRLVWFILNFVYFCLMKEWSVLNGKQQAEVRKLLKIIYCNQMYKKLPIYTHLLTGLCYVSKNERMWNHLYGRGASPDPC